MFAGVVVKKPGARSLTGGVSWQQSVRRLDACFRDWNVSPWCAILLDMSPLATKALNGRVPKSVDGRSYPKHLARYHAYDEQLLPLLARLAPATFDDLAAEIEDPRVRAALGRWLTSAEWRGLLVHDDTSARLPRIFTLGPKAQAHLPSAA